MQHIKHTIRSVGKNENGAVIILWGLLLSTIIGAVGLGVETTSWYFTQRDLQKASDSAAIAAAYAIGTSNANYQTLAQAEYTRLGLTNVTVTAHQPPTSGTYAGNSNAVEIIATQSINTSFSKMVSNVSNIPITARSVVRVTTPGSTGSSSGNACVLALSKSTSTNVTINGNTTINLPDCVVASNSTSSQAIYMNGNSSLTVADLYTTGNYSQGNNATFTHSQANVVGNSATTIADPYSTLPIPSTSHCDYTDYSVSGTATINPGVYCGGLTISNHANVTMNPGTYVMTNSSNGGMCGGGISGDAFSVGAQATVSGNGVTIIMTASSGSNIQSLTFNGGATLNLSAPTTGTYAGILFYQDRNAPAGGVNKFNGGSTSNIVGTLYFPSQEVDFSGDTTATGVCARIVANSVTFIGNSDFKNGACPSGYPTIAVGSGSSTTTNASGETLVE